MAQATPAYNIFSGGIISELIADRTDATQNQTGLRQLMNGVVTVQGPIIKRPGFKLVGATKFSDSACNLLDYQFNADQAYVLEFGMGYLRIITRGIDDTLGYIESGGQPLELVTPYHLDSDITALYLFSQGDVAYILSKNHAVRVLTRISETNWTLEEYVFTVPPFRSENLTDTRVVASGQSGAVTLTADAAIFDANMLGGYFKLSEPIASRHDTWASGVAYTIGDTVKNEGSVYICTTAGTSGTREPVHLTGVEFDGDTGAEWAYEHSGYGIVELTGYTSTTVMTGTVTTHLVLPYSVTTDDVYNGTQLWSEGAFSDKNGYPATGLFRDNRLWLSAVPNIPNDIWGSKIDAYADFSLGANDDDAIQITLNTEKTEFIEWMLSGTDMVVGTTGGEIIITSSGPIITPSDISVRVHTSFGSAPDRRPLHIGQSYMFVQRGGRSIYNYGYGFGITDSDYAGYSLTMKAEGKLLDSETDTFSDLAYQRNPIPIVWTVASGNLIGLTYDQLNQVEGFHKHATDGEFQSLCVIPDDVSSRDLLFTTIQYSDRRHVCVMASYECMFRGVGEQVFVDSAIEAEDVSGTISGLDALEGMTVSVVLDDAVHPDRTVSGGQITIAYPASKALVGLSYRHYMQTPPVDAGSKTGTSLGVTKRINRAHVSAAYTAPGLMIGTEEDDLTLLTVRNTNDNLGEAVPLFTGIAEGSGVSGSVSRELSLWVEHTTPLPSVIRGIYPKVDTNNE